MTAQDIQATPDRELNALVAEHLFGWRWWARLNRELAYDYQEGEPRPPEVEVERMAIYPPADSGLVRWNWDSRSRDVTDLDPALRPPRFSDWDHCDLPRYSQDGNAMLAVLEKMRADGWMVSIGINLNELLDSLEASPQCSFLSERRNAHERAGAATLPQAVCRAALLATLAARNPPADG